MMTVAAVAASALPRARAFVPGAPAVVLRLGGRVGPTPQTARSAALPARRVGVRMVATEPAKASGKEEGSVPEPSPDFKFSMEDIVSVCKRRGFIFPSSEIYQGFAGFYDYGPLGCEMKQNIKKVWWRDMVHRRDDMVGLDSSIIASPSIWKSSGHVDGFSDPMVDCKESKQRFRADQLFYGKVQIKDGELLGYVSVMESDTMQEEADKQALKMKKKAAKQGELLPVELREVAECPLDEISLVPSPATGEPGSLTPPRAFNLMFQTQVRLDVFPHARACVRMYVTTGFNLTFQTQLCLERVCLCVHACACVWQIHARCHTHIPARTHRWVQ